MSLHEQKLKETEDLKAGPLSVLYIAVKENSQVLINIRNNKNLLEGQRHMIAT